MSLLQSTLETYLLDQQTTLTHKEESKPTKYYDKAQYPEGFFTSL